MLAFTQIVAALLAGNCVVLKPPESCPLTLIQSVRMFAEELPPGAINVVTGLPSEIGDALTTHPDVGKIGFTGSIPSARHIMANAVQSIKGVTLELGGNDPAIVLDDAEFDAPTLSRMLGATFMMSGQVCMAIKRIYVPAKRSNEFLEKFGAAVDSIVVGDGLEPSVTMGPLHTQKAQTRANGLVEDAARRGATVKPMGKIDSEATFSKGYFMRPTVVTDITDDAPLMSEEQFCPAIPVDNLRNAGRRRHARKPNSVWPEWVGVGPRHGSSPRCGAKNRSRSGLGEHTRGARHQPLGAVRRSQAEWDWPEIRY